jgi:hypothetical protein
MAFKKNNNKKKEKNLVKNTSLLEILVLSLADQ